MFPRQLVTILLTIILVLATAVSAGSAPPDPPIAAAETTTLPYSATLTGLAGQPAADGLYDLRFALYDAAEGGQLLWSEMQSGILVKSGELGTTLGLVSPLPASVFAGGPLWLAVDVRGPGQTGFDALSPRQQVTLAAAAPATSSAPAAPQALSCAHTHLGESWVGAYPDYTFRVQNTSTGDGIRGISSSTSVEYAGIYGVNNSTGSGVYGYSSAGVGVRGRSNSNVGVLAESVSNDGVSSKSSAAGRSGVYGHNDGAAGTVGYGVFGRASNGDGLGAEGNDASGYDQLADVVLYGVRGEILAPSTYLNLSSNQLINMILDNDNNSDDNTTELRVFIGVDQIVFTVDELGNTWAKGTKAALVQTDSAGQRQLYAVESTGVWFEDFGTATLVDGQIVVKIDDVFLQTISPEAGYHVFLTPLGDCNGLYVAAKDAGSFTVRELAGGKSNVSFDWRLSGKRRGYETSRLDQVIETGEVKR